MRVCVDYIDYIDHINTRSQNLKKIMKCLNSFKALCLSTAKKTGHPFCFQQLLAATFQKFDFLLLTIIFMRNGKSYQQKMKANHW